MDVSSELDLKRVLRVIYKKKIPFFLAISVVTSALIVFSYLMPKTYEAKSVIFIERNVLDELIKNVTVTSSLEEKIKALSIVMKSRSLILKVMEDMNLTAGKSQEQIEGMISVFQEKTQVKTEVNKATQRDMDLFIVSFEDSDPKRASTFVNALVKRYIDDNLSLKREEAYGASKFLLDQISSFKVKLEKIETAIARERKERPIPEKSLPIFERLQELYRKREALLGQYTESHPDVIKLKGEIATLEAQARVATPAPDQNRTALIDLERERETTKKIYEDLLATLRKSEVSAQLEVQDKAGAFRILDPAIVPTRPLSPNMPRMILVSVALGLAAGIGLIIALDLSDHSVKSVATLKRMGLPVLAVISTMRTDQQNAAVKRTDSIVYSAAGLYLAVLLVIAALEVFGLPYVDDFIHQTKAQIKSAMKSTQHKPQEKL